MTTLIAVLGEALIDAFPGREVVGGAPFNVARNLAALGETPLMLTRIGDDARGAAIAAEFDRHGMTMRGLQRDPHRATGVVQVLIDEARPEQHRFVIETGCAWEALDKADVRQALSATPPALVYFGTLAQREATARAAIRTGLAEAAAVGARRFLDLNLRDGLPDARHLAEESLDLADVLKVNDAELAQLQAWFGLAAESLARRFSLRQLIVTRGGEGWSCFDAETERWLHGSAPAVTVRDTVGAGDAFAAVTLQGLLRQWPLEHTMQRAAAHAARACQFEGALGYWSQENPGA
ncbi:PfkB family carbohydrate kinase [Pelomonas sp. SE-A7]|uniref:PfkB family carbohydrate kinase n=1 Tax=Pelomonas sp. SE-A7 TaxID=3054953 RepID=UPI00259CEC96|nr:PfkB family carbohydrate kinase [Pelomonas sp. SE-A7]MDM4766316.1 PfkB family carbohydrate kinase [Pelomonas sp. SE-A7]